MIFNKEDDIDCNADAILSYRLYKQLRVSSF